MALAAGNQLGSYRIAWGHGGSDHKKVLLKLRVASLEGCEKVLA